MELCVRSEVIITPALLTLGCLSCRLQEGGLEGACFQLVNCCRLPRAFQGHWPHSPSNSTAQAAGLAWTTLWLSHGECLCEAGRRGPLFAGCWTGVAPRCRPSLPASYQHVNKPQPWEAGIAWGKRMAGVRCLRRGSSITGTVSSEIPETCIQACLCLLVCCTTVSASVSPCIVEEHMRTNSWGRVSIKCGGS